MRPLAVSLAFALVAASAAAQTDTAAQSSAPVTTLHVSSRTVAISAVVKAKDGSSVAGLTKDDFTLKQDGKEQPIRYFAPAEDLPLTFAVMVDVSGSQRTFVGDESLASDVFFRTVLGRPQDRAMLIEFDADVTQLRDLTNDPNKLHLALSSLGLRPERQGGTLLFDAIEAIARQSLGHATGRKAMVLLTDGGDVGSHNKIDAAIARAQQGNVQIYSVYYSDLSVNSFAPTPGSGIRLANGFNNLKKLSTATGGRVFTVGQCISLQSIYNQIAQDLRTQYELGYTPPADTAPGKFHKLEVRVKDKSATVLARTGFTAEP